MKFKKLAFIFVLSFINLQVFSQTINDTQIIKTDHWVYDAINKLCKEQKIAVFNENSMLSVGELKFYFNEIEYEKLSESGKLNYEYVKEFLYTNQNIIKDFNNVTKTEWMDTSAFRFNINLIANPEFYYKSNEDIDWTFNYHYKDNFLTAPLQFGLSNYITIETDPFFGKSHYGAALSNNYSNIPYRKDDLEFLFIRNAYGSAGKTFDKWGINFTVAKEGLRIGNPSMASIIYNNTFETDGYAQLNIYSKSFKYSMDVVQIDFEKYLYLHQIEFIILKNIKVALIEGSLACDSLQLRYFNPFMFMHQMSGWNDYCQDNSPYGEEKFCAYFCWMLEWTPIKNTRFYLLYSQNEIQPPWEQNSKVGALYPDSLGLQIGTDISIPYKQNSYFNISFEGVYTSPYLYFKHTPQASLYRSREDNLQDDDIKSWIGSPYGPDSIGLQFSVGYEQSQKWKVNFGYLFTMKGENDFNRFGEEETYKDTSKGEDKYSSYYPTVKYELGRYDDYDELKDEARNMFPSGTIQFTNQIVINGQYILNKHIKFDGQCVYTFVNNCQHIDGKFEHGIELALSMTYNLF